MIDVFLAGDLGGTKMAAALVDATGNILIEDSAATEAVRGIEDVTERFAGLLLAVQRQGAPARPAGVGAGTPGLVDWPAGVPLVRPPDNVNPDCSVNSRTLMYQPCAANMYQKNRRTHCETLRLV